MGPRRMAVDDQREAVGLDLDLLASMGPRRMAVDDLLGHQRRFAASEASMGPRRMAVDDRRQRRTDGDAEAGFNGATAHGRG